MGPADMAAIDAELVNKIIVVMVNAIMLFILNPSFQNSIIAIPICISVKNKQNSSNFFYNNCTVKPATQEIYISRGVKLP